MRCPYCVSEIDDKALACPRCARDLYLFKPLLEKIGQLEKTLAEQAKAAAADSEPRIAALEKELAELKSQRAEAIPVEVRPIKDQPFYHLFAENAESEYIAYVSEQNLLPDNSGEPIRHPQVAEVFEPDGDGSFKPRNTQLN